jgi:hypothetical protein
VVLRGSGTGCSLKTVYACQIRSYEKTGSNEPRIYVTCLKYWGYDDTFGEMWTNGSTKRAKNG